MSQQQRADNVSIDDIPVDIDNTQSGEVNPTDVPEEIESITRDSPVSTHQRIRWSC